MVDMKKICNFEQLKNIIENTDLTNYKSIPFWSWNGKLDEDELRRQIVEMYSAGIGGFIMHARAGLETEYMGEKWFSCVGACLQKAKELGMRAWLYDENGYPSGFAGGKLLNKEEYLAQYLEYEIKSSFDESAFASFVYTDGKYKRIYNELNGIEEYHCIYLRTSLTMTDILNPNVVDAFIKETHEKYYQRFSKSFGEELEGFFTDEPQYFRNKTPFTKVLLPEFENKGLNLIDGLIYLFVSTEEGYSFRFQYYEMLNKLYSENYYKKIFDWCTEHKVKLTGHSIEENKLSTQMWCCAGVMSSYEYEHIPGIDCLYNKNLSELSPKQVSSVAAQLGKNIVLTETFAGCGNSATPRDLKSIAESQYFHGVNKMCHHLWAYSVAKQGKFDFPPSFSRHAGWLNEFRRFNDYFTKLGFIIANTKEKLSVAIIHPMRALYLEYIRSLDFKSVEKIEKDFSELLLTLRKFGVGYHFIDETILAKYGKTKENFLLVGNCSYSTVIVPVMKNISQTTLNLLSEYDGKLCVLDEINYIEGIKKEIKLESNITLSEIIENNSLKFKCYDGNTFVTNRMGDIGEFIFLKNLSNKESSICILEGVSKYFVEINLEDYKVNAVEDVFELKPNASAILIREESCLLPRKDTITDVTSSFKTIKITDNYLLLDYISFSKDGQNFSPFRYYQAVFEELLREDYKGILYVRQKFVLNENMPLSLLIESENYISLKLNSGEVPISSSSFDIGFVEGDLTGLTVKGVNILEYSIDYYQHEGVQFALFDSRATENMRNCLYYDCSIDPVYIKGEFTVQEDGSLDKKQHSNIGSSLVENGYPFFFGEVEYLGEYNYDGNGNVEILLEGKYLVANVLVNNKVKNIVLDDKTDITDLLVCGKNQILIVVKYGLRNFFGPHHYDVQDEPLAVYPEKFTFRGLWTGYIAENFTNSYKLFPYGIEKIKIIEKQKMEDL